MSRDEFHQITVEDNKHNMCHVILGGASDQGNVWVSSFNNPGE